MLKRDICQCWEVKTLTGVCMADTKHWVSLLTNLVWKHKIVWLRWNLNWMVILMMIYGKSMLQVTLHCQKSDLWLGTVTCLKATFCCLFYILKVSSMVIFPLMSEIKRCHNLMMRGITLHISWWSSLCSSTLLPYLVKKILLYLKSNMEKSSIYFCPLFLYLVKKIPIYLEKYNDNWH